MELDRASTPTESGLSLGEKLVVLLGGMLSALVLTGINAVLPSIDGALSHGLSDQMLVKQLVGGASVAMVVGALLGGFLVSAIGMRRMLLFASTLYVLAGKGGLYIRDLPLLVASRRMLGLVAAMIQVTSLTLVNSHLDGNRRAKWMGLHVSIGMLSTLFIYPISGFLGTISWKFPFAEYGLGTLPIVAALSRTAGIQEW